MLDLDRTSEFNQAATASCPIEHLASILPECKK